MTSGCFLFLNHFAIVSFISLKGICCCKPIIQGKCLEAHYVQTFPLCNCPYVMTAPVFCSLKYEVGNILASLFNKKILITSTTLRVDPGIKITFFTRCYLNKIIFNFFKKFLSYLRFPQKLVGHFPEIYCQIWVRRYRFMF